MSALIVGLTGQTGAGKSTVSDYFAKEGFSVLDCDRIAHEVVMPGKEGLTVIRNEFSDAVLAPDQSLDRKALARIVFSDRQRLDRLNEILFPVVLKAVGAEISKLEAAGHEVIVLDAPTLFESGADRMCGIIVSVTAKKVLRLRRITERDKIDESLALARISSQKSESFFRTHSDIIIENNDGLSSLLIQTEEASRQIRKRLNGN